MAGTDRTATHAVEFLQALQEKPYSHSLFQALRRLDCLYPGKPKIGESVKANDDPFRIGEFPSLKFAPSEIQSCEPGKEGRPPRLLVYSFGLFGPNGPLPLHLTEWAGDRLRRFDTTFPRFLDVFHHRMLALFYRAWANAQPTVNLDRPESDRFAIYLGSLFGVALRTTQGQDAVPDHEKLHFAGLLGCQTRNAEGLESILQHFFDMPLCIEEFIGQWVEVPASARWRLGESASTGALGLSATVGSRMWDCQQKFRIVIGPVCLEEYESLLPGESSFERLAAVVRNYVGFEFDWDVNVIIRKEEVPRLQLGEAGRLGWTSWLTGRQPERDVADPILDPAVHAA